MDKFSLMRIYQMQLCHLYVTDNLERLDDNGVRENLVNRQFMGIYLNPMIPQTSI